LSAGELSSAPLAFPESIVQGLHHTTLATLRSDVLAAISERANAPDIPLSSFLSKFAVPHLFCLYFLLDVPIDMEILVRAAFRASLCLHNPSAATSLAARVHSKLMRSDFFRKLMPLLSAFSFVHQSPCVQRKSAHTACSLFTAGDASLSSLTRVYHNVVFDARTSYVGHYTGKTDRPLRRIAEEWVSHGPCYPILLALVDSSLARQYEDLFILMYANGKSLNKAFPLLASADSLTVLARRLDSQAHALAFRRTGSSARTQGFPNLSRFPVFSARRGKSVVLPSFAHFSAGKQKLVILRALRSCGIPAPATVSLSGPPTVSSALTNVVPWFNKQNWWKHLSDYSAALLHGMPLPVCPLDGPHSAVALTSLFPALAGAKTPIRFSKQAAAELFASNVRSLIHSRISELVHASFNPALVTMLNGLPDSQWFCQSPPTFHQSSFGPSVSQIADAKSFIRSKGLICSPLDHHSQHLYLICPCLMIKLVMFNALGPLNAYRHHIFHNQQMSASLKYRIIASVTRRQGWKSQFRIVHFPLALAGIKSVKPFLHILPSLSHSRVDVANIFGLPKLPKGHVGPPPSIIDGESLRLRVVMNQRRHPARPLYKRAVIFFKFLLDSVVQRFDLPIASDSVSSQNLLVQQALSKGLASSQLVATQLDLKDMFPSIPNQQLVKACKWACEVAFKGKKFLWAMGQSVFPSDNPPDGRFALSCALILDIVKADLGSRYASFGRDSIEDSLSALVVQESGGLSIGGSLSSIMANIWGAHRLRLNADAWVDHPSAVCGFTDDYIVIHRPENPPPLLSDLSRFFGGMEYTCSVASRQFYMGYHVKLNFGLLLLPDVLSFQKLRHLHWCTQHTYQLKTGFLYGTLLRMLRLVNIQSECGLSRHLVRSMIVRHCISFFVRRLLYPVTVVRHAVDRISGQF
jgi:hypothetical protein